MSQSTRCRLCLNSCSESTPLYDANGRYNGPLYEITVKYFDPMVLSPVNAGEFRVMCSQCWRQIFEFNNFQQAVLVAQSKLLEIRQKQVQQVRVSVNPHEAAPSTATTRNSGMLNVLMDHVDNYSTISISSDEESSSPKIATRRDNVLKTSTPAHYNDQDEEDNVSLDEYDDPVGVFTGGQFHNEPGNMDHSLQSELDVAELNTEVQTSVVTTASETGLRGKTGLNSGDQTSTVPPASEIAICYSLQNSLKRTGTLPVDGECVIQYKGRTSSSKLENYIAKWKQMLDCPICNESFADYAHFSGHFKIAHPDEKRYLMCCGRRFYQRYSLAQHIELIHHHEIKTTAQCENDLSTVSANEAEGKTAEKAVGNNTKCQAEHFVTMYRVNRPLKEIDNYIATWKTQLNCPVCNESSPNFAYLSEHFKMKHPQEKYYIQCCQSKFYSRSRFAKHVRVHIQNKDLPCELCGKVCHTITSLSRHKLRRHSKTGDTDLTALGERN